MYSFLGDLFEGHITNLVEGARGPQRACRIANIMVALISDTGLMVQD